MVKMVLTYDFERYGNPFLGTNHPNNLQDRKYALTGLEIILKIHHKYKIDGTVFILGKLLELCEKEVKTLLKKYSIDIQQHTYSHILFKKDKRRVKNPASLEEIKQEIRTTSDLIKEKLHVDVIGLCIPIGFHDGLKNETETLNILKREGMKFIKSDTRGEGNKLPGPFVVNGNPKQPYFYENGIFEITGQGWHDCVIKGLIPHEMPHRIANNPSEELKYYINDINSAIFHSNIVYSPSFHPWSIAIKDSKGYVLNHLIKYAIKKNIKFLSATDFFYDSLEDPSILHK